MNKKIIPFLFVILIFLSSNFKAFSQEEMFFTDAQKDKVVLRWAVDDWKDILGFNIYRKLQSAANWQKLNSEVISRKKQVDEIIKILGPDEAGLYLSLFGIKGEVKELDDERFYKLVEAKGGWQWLGAFSLLYPNIAKALGLIYEDKDISSGAKYDYKITKVLNSGAESDLFQTKVAVNAGKINEIAVPLDFKGKAADSKALFNWKYDINFNKENYIISYNLYRRSEKETEFKKINKTPIFIIGSKTQGAETTFPEHFYVDEGLTNGAKYFYKLTALNAVGRESNFSEEVLVEPKDLTAPSMPENLSYKIEDNNILLEWQANKETDLAGYNIYRSLNAESGFEKINEKLLKENKFLDKNVQANLIYWYRATAVDTSENESYPSISVSVLITDKTPPKPPLGLKANSEEGKIILEWQANTEADLAGYKLYRATKETGAFILLTQEPVKQNKYSDNIDASSEATYWYKITAVDTSFNESDFSEIVKARLPDKTAPRAPKIFKSFSKNEEIFISWLPNPEKDLAGYNIYRKDEESAKANKLNTELIAKDKNEFSDKRVLHEKKLFYSVTAIDEAGNESAPSSEAALVGVDETPPKAPEGLSVKISEDKEGITLVWQKNKEPDLKSYTVYRKEDEEFVKIAPFIEKEEYVDKAVKDGVNYLYYISAFDVSNNESKSSKEAQIKFKK